MPSDQTQEYLNQQAYLSVTGESEFDQEHFDQIFLGHTTVEEWVKERIREHLLIFARFENHGTEFASRESLDRRRDGYKEFVEELLDHVDLHKWSDRYGSLRQVHQRGYDDTTRYYLFDIDA